MTSYRAVCCALLLSIAASTPVSAAEKKAAKAPPGRTETLACRLGTEDRHARIAVVVIKGKTDSFAYYSKWKPRTCSIYLQRNRDNYSKWADTGAITTVNLEKGAFLIEHKAGEYHFIFRDIDRERYCGMDGVINGSLKIKRGSDQCVLDGEIMVEGTPLGEAHAHTHAREPEGPLSSAGASDVAPAPAPPASSAATPQPQKPAAAKVEAPVPAAKAQESAAAPAPAAAEQKPQATVAQPADAPASTAAGPAKEAPAPAATAAEKPPSSNPFSAFFRSIAPSTPPEGQSP